MEHLHHHRHQGPPGKLKWAGRASVLGTLTERPEEAPPRDDALHDAQMLGVTLPAGMLERDEEDGLWPENVAAVEAYLVVSTQWRITGRADGGLHAVGLDYSGVSKGFEMAGIAVSPALWSDLQMVEIGARAAMNGEKS